MGWSWPANRRVLYNRASCDVDGKPWIRLANKSGGAKASKSGLATTCRTSKLIPSRRITWAIHYECGGCRPNLWPARGLRRWSVPEYYEPTESPIDNPLHPQQTHNPVVKRFKTRTINTPHPRTVTRLSARPTA